ncbi:MAG: type VI secretion system tip protein VgrG [Bacteroidetes bacterium]|nr:type VI secretion system tip protein VgrG [Bacteroidota bacterium]
MPDNSPVTASQNSDAPDAEQQIQNTQGGVQDLLSQVSGITATLDEAEAKLSAVSDTIDQADEALGTIPGIMLEVTGLEEVPEVPEVAAVAIVAGAEVETPVAAAVAAAADQSTELPVYLTLTTPLGDDKLLLQKITGEEFISGLFHFSLEMYSKDSAIDFTQIIGKTVTVSIALADETKRHINGHVAKFGHGGSSDVYSYYFAEIVPWLWMLSLTKDSKIFQEKTVIEIITSIFDDAGFTDYKNSTTATYTAREYCVQYQESAFNFVSRLMEDEGIFYFFEHTEDKHTLILADDSSAYQDVAGLTKARFAKARRSGSNSR